MCHYQWDFVRFIKNQYFNMAEFLISSAHRIIRFLTDVYWLRQQFVSSEAQRQKYLTVNPCSNGLNPCSNGYLVERKIILGEWHHQRKCSILLSEMKPWKSEFQYLGKVNCEVLWILHSKYSRLSLLQYCGDKENVSIYPDYHYNQYKFL